MTKSWGWKQFAYKKLGKIPHPFKKIYSPGDPGADEKGNVLQSNVNSMVEMTDFRQASHIHQANLRAYEKTINILKDTVDLLKSH